MREVSTAGCRLSPNAVPEAATPAGGASPRRRRAVEEVQGDNAAACGSSQAQAQQLEQELTREIAALARQRDEADRLTLRAGTAGTLLLERPDDLPGRWLRKGEIVGYLRTPDPPLVRVALSQGDVDTVRLGTRAVEALPQDSSARARHGCEARRRRSDAQFLLGRGRRRDRRRSTRRQGLTTLDRIESNSNAADPRPGWAEGSRALRHAADRSGRARGEPAPRLSGSSRYERVVALLAIDAFGAQRLRRAP